MSVKHAKNWLFGLFTAHLSRGLTWVLFGVFKSSIWEVLVPASEACPCSSLDQAEHAATFASVEIVIERAASKRSSHDYKTNEELLKLVTHAEARLKLDQPQEQETLKLSKLDDDAPGGSPWRYIVTQKGNAPYQIM